MLVTFLGLSCASFFSHSNSSGYFILMSFTKKRAFMFSHFFPFIFFVFNCSVFNYNSNNDDALSNSAKRERLVCWIQRSLSRSLSSSVLLCFARALPRSLSLLIHSFAGWVKILKMRARRFGSKLLTTFINSMCVCVCVAIVYQQIASAARLLNSVDTHSILISFTQTHFFYFSCSTKHKRLSTHCAGRQTEFNFCSSDKTTK